MSRKPSASQVDKNAWEVVYNSEEVMVKVAEVSIAEYTLPNRTAGYRVVPANTAGSFRAEFWKVMPKGKNGKAKTFFGESAWSDARRYASDFDFGAWSI